MQISSLNLLNRFTYQPTTISTLDNVGKLFKAEAPNPTELGDDNGIGTNSTTTDVFIYSRLGLEAGKTAPARAVVLENADGSYFKLDLNANDKVNLVAKGRNIDMYVYRPGDGTAEKFSFDKKGVFASATTLDVQSFSEAEVLTKRDLDNNGSVGAKLLKDTAGVTALSTGASKATGGIFNVNVMGQDIYVVGDKTDRLSRINANAKTLLNADGSYWKPELPAETLRAVQNKTTNTWEIFATVAKANPADGHATTTKYSFGADKKLTAVEELTADEVVAAEVASKKDLNVDGAYGLKIESTLDRVGGLVKGKLAGQDVLLAKLASTDTTGGRAVSLGNQLINTDGTAWNVKSGYEASALVKTSAAGAANATYAVYAFKAADGSTAADKNDVLRFDFTQNGTQLDIDAETAAGVSVSAIEMANAEKLFKRDLNSDNLFGATIVSLEDRSTGLYKAEMLGETFFMAGHLGNKVRTTGTTGALAQGSSGALLNRDGTAWAPPSGAPVSALIDTSTGGTTSYAAYTLDTASQEVRRFDFIENSDGNFDVTAASDGGIVLDDALVLAELEKTTKRDINADGIYGADIETKIDSVVGLYKASVGGQEYFLAGHQANNKDRVTGLTGALAQDMSGALLAKDGSAWQLPSSAATYELTSIVSNGSGYSVYASTSNKQSVLRFDFDADGDHFKVTDGTQVGVSVKAAEMATAEKTSARDLNKDDDFGAAIGSVVDRTVGLYKAAIMGQDFFLAGHQADGSVRRTGSNGSLAQDLSGTLLQKDGSAWAVKAGYEASSLVQTSAANTSPTTYSLYAYKAADGATPADKTDVLQFDFTQDADGNFVIEDDSIPGIRVSADALAIKEASLQRDLNQDNAFGVTITDTLDAVGGLFLASALGSEFLMAGANLSSSANAGLDLEKALLDSEGNAWTPAGVADVSANLMTVVRSSTAGTFSVYAQDDAGDFSQYDFVAYKQVGNSIQLDDAALVAAEKTHGRDITGEGKYGANITAALDLAGGLYSGSIGAHTPVLFKASANLPTSSLVAANALDATSALKDATGFWSGPAAGFTAQTAFDDGTDFVVIATNNAGDVQKYTFDTTKDNALVHAKSGTITLSDLATLEEAEGRDLNRDQVFAVRVNTSAVDSVGGLFTGSAGGQDFLIVDSSASNITNLDNALLTAQGARWSPGSYDKLVLEVTVSGHDVYAKSTNAGTTTYTRYSFDSDNKLSATSSPLTDTELALAEAVIGRDINADNAIGVKVTEKTHATSGLYQGSINSQNYVLLAHDAAGVATSNLHGATDPEGKILFTQNGSTPWSPAAGFTLSHASYNLDSAGDLSSIYVFAEKTSDGSQHRFMFTADHVLVKSDELSQAQKVAAATATSPTYTDVDTRGSTDLFKTSIMGQDYYVVGPSGTADLSKALFDEDDAAWAPGSGYEVGGIVDTTGTGGTYDVYTYKLTGSEVTSVQKSSWDADMNFMGTREADAAALVAVEAANARDYSGDNVVGFRVTTGAAALGYKGVTTAAFVDSANVTYLLVGEDLATGSAAAPLDLSKALLNANGSGPWSPDAGYKIKFVDDRTSADTTRHVYAIKTGTGAAADLAMRYEFDKTSGKSTGDGVAVSMFEMAALEVTQNTDINDDQYVGAVTVSAYKDDLSDLSPSFETDLLNITYGGASFLAVNTATSGDDKLSMAGVLLNQDGTAWELPSDGSFTLKGVYQADTIGSGAASKPLELYGLNATGQVTQFRFAANVDTFGARTTGYTLMDANVRSDGYLNPIQGSVLAATEVSTGYDLNGDEAVGYKRIANPLVRDDSGTTNTGWSLGTASVSNGSAAAADEIYIVSQDFAATSSISASADDSTSGSVGGSALYTSTGDYWKPDTGFTVKSVLNDGSDVKVWAQGTNSTGDKVYQEYVFSLNSDNKWEVDSSSIVDDADFDGDGTDDALSTDALLAEEINKVRDLNGDGAVGLIVDSRVTTSNGTSVFKATIDTQNYYIVGTDADVASGIPFAPTDPADLNVLMADATTRWAPAGALTVTGFREATAAEVLADADNAWAVELSDSSTVMFDSSYLEI
jgi:hypothetical protein